MKHTAKVFIHLCNYILKESDISTYVLLDKYQTDHLEGQFDQYRQIDGLQYHASATEILESGRRLKVLSIIKLKSSLKGILTERILKVLL